MSQPIDIGIPEDTRLEIADGLSHVLADTYTLYLKTHNYHWNVTGPLFNTLHLMFEVAVQRAVAGRRPDRRADPLARVVRARAPARSSAPLTAIAEADGVPKAEEMIRDLVIGHETVVRTARKIFPVIEQAGDEPSADLLTQRMQEHEKTAWMLRSMLARDERVLERANCSRPDRRRRPASDIVARPRPCVARRWSGPVQRVPVNQVRTGR